MRVAERVEELRRRRGPRVTTQTTHAELEPAAGTAVLERGVAQKMTLRPMPYSGRNELETLLASEDVADWIAVSEMFLGKPGKGFAFVPKHGSNSYSRESAAALRNLGAGVAEEEEEEAQNG